jgi:hypothetical protein
MRSEDDITVERRLFTQFPGGLLTGYEESPSVSTTGTGTFTATIARDNEVIQYTDVRRRIAGCRER